LNSYRFCFQNAKGKFTGAVSQPFADDGSALRHAKRLLTVHHVVEVWRGELRLALFNARLQACNATTRAPSRSRADVNRKPLLRLV
jgi:hypothetical protein